MRAWPHGRCIRRFTAAATSQREMKFREEQEAFPNEIWEQGEHGMRQIASCRLRRSGQQRSLGHPESGGCRILVIEFSNDEAHTRVSVVRCVS
jgi:hypothetical protein